MDDRGFTTTDEQQRDESAGRQEPDYPRIEHHGVIGDLSTVALIDLGGRIDFLCWPQFDSPTIFCSLLDAKKGGSFEIVPDLGEDVRHKQLYLPDTNVLVSRFLAEDGLAEVTDLMPLDDGPQRLIRIVRCVRGEIDFAVTCAPRFDYARMDHEAELSEDGMSVIFRPEAGEPIRVLSTMPLELDGKDLTARFSLKRNATATFLLETYVEGEALPCGLEGYGTQCFEATIAYWREWSSKNTYQGRWREVVHRSGLILKLLTDKKHGSIVAAPTFGLPEVLGGARNWDYRYTWVRDAAFTLYALIRLGYTEEAHEFVGWIEARVAEDKNLKDGHLRVLYGVDGHDRLDERTLDHLEGYVKSSPVRIGNGAVGQLQLDIYGTLIDAIYLANKYGCPISHDAWRSVVSIVDWVAQNWEQPDEGIWEFRGGKREFLHSRLMCWVCLDRAVRMARKRSLPAPVERWEAERDRIYNDIFDNFWNAEMGTFVQAKGSKAVDASCLLMPLVKFISPVDPRWLSTLDTVKEHLADDALVRRYDAQASADIDGLEGMEGSFTACSFWYVECLARAGRVEEARLLFEKMLSYANHVGLYAEELGRAGDHLGNFPQALTHLTLISAAHALDRALDQADGCTG